MLDAGEVAADAVMWLAESEFSSTIAGATTPRGHLRLKVAAILGGWTGFGLRGDIAM
jgi:hypothetical protein